LPGTAVVRQSGTDSSGGDSEGGLVSDVGSEIKVTLDRWSLGQLGVSDLLAAAAVIVAGFVVAWVVRRLIKRSTRHMTGVTLTAVGTVGKLVGALIHLLAAALALEILGFSLGPIFALLLIAIMVLLLLRPMITNLSDGLLLQLRGAVEAGDLVLAARDVLGVVQEITTRTTVIDTEDGRRVHVPNSDVLGDVIVNYTALGQRRSSFEIMVRYDEDLQLVMSTMRLALAQVDAIHTDPQPDLQVDRVVGRLVVIRVLVWHPPSLQAQREALDESTRGVLTDLRAAGIELDGPTLVDLYSDTPPSNHDRTD
jgi:small-conductance mechanosensitive channel